MNAIEDGRRGRLARVGEIPTAGMRGMRKELGSNVEAASRLRVRDMAGPAATGFFARYGASTLALTHC